MIVTKTEYGLTIIVWHKSGGQICAVSFESDRPFAAMHAGHGVKLGEIEGFGESRLVIGKIREVHHAIAGGRLFKHHTTVHIDQGE